MRSVAAANAAAAGHCTHRPTSAPPPAQASITLVCHRWHRLFYSEPALWRSLELPAKSLAYANVAGRAQQWFAAKARLLRRVGGFVQHLKYKRTQSYFQDGYNKMLDVQQVAADCGGEWQLGSSVLAHLSTVQSLRLEWITVDAAAAAALQRLTSLTQLYIEGDDDLPGSLLAALPSLPQLLSLRLFGGTMPGLRAALCPLTQLTQLECAAAEPLPPLTILFPLAQLRQLQWEEQRQDGTLLFDVQLLLARLPQLDGWRIGSYWTQLEGALKVRFAAADDGQPARCAA